MSSFYHDGQCRMSGSEKFDQHALHDAVQHHLVLNQGTPPLEYLLLGVPKESRVEDSAFVILLVVTFVAFSHIISRPKNLPKHTKTTSNLKITL